MNHPLGAYARSDSPHQRPASTAGRSSFGSHPHPHPQQPLPHSHAIDDAGPLSDRPSIVNPAPQPLHPHSQPHSHAHPPHQNQNQHLHSHYPHYSPHHHAPAHSMDPAWAPAIWHGDEAPGAGRNSFRSYPDDDGLRSLHPDLRPTEPPVPSPTAIHPGFLTASPAERGGEAMSISALLSEDSNSLPPESARRKSRRKSSRPRDRDDAAYAAKLPPPTPTTGQSNGLFPDPASLLANADDDTDDDLVAEKLQFQAHLRKRQAKVENEEARSRKRRRAEQTADVHAQCEENATRALARAREGCYEKAVAKVRAEAEAAERERRRVLAARRKQEQALRAQQQQQVEATARESPATARSSPQIARRLSQSPAAAASGALPALSEHGDVSDPEFVPQEGKRLRRSTIAAGAAPSQKQYDQLYESIWRDISRKDVGKVHRIYVASLNVKQSNFRKTAQLAAKEARRWQFRTNKNVKDLQVKAKRAMREMLVFWKRNERDERELRRKAEKDAAEKAKKWEEQRESRRQARKLNFLITQTELYSHFIGRKIKTVQIEGTAPRQDLDLPDEVPLAVRGKTGKFEELDFDAEDESVLKNAAMANAQHAIQAAQDRAKQFNTVAPDSKTPQVDLSNVDLDSGEMNFQNPTGLGDIDIEAPKMLMAQLKEYQLKGLNWLVNLYEQGINGILADEMGLGKTVQSIAVMAYLAEKHNIWGPFLVIAPASTLHNWQQEITRFVPQLKALPYWGNAKDRKILRKFWDRNKLTYDRDAPFHILITSYQLVVSDAQYFSRVKWQYMILDEAQAIKSSSSSRWKSLLAFQCRNRLLLTGTPIQNSMQELWALLHFIMPSLFDSHDEFSEWFSKDIESHAQSNTQLNESQLKRLHMILKPFMLRRIKKHVQKELGEKIELDVFCDLTYRQRAMYKGLREKISFLDLIEKVAMGGEENSQSLMNLVMQFRKVCNHPDLFERADTTSPLLLASFAETASFLREGSFVHVPYSTRNLVRYRMPKPVYRLGRLDVPSEQSSAGFRHKYLRHLLNIWSADYLHDESKHASAFSWLRFIDTSAGEAAASVHSSTLDSAVALLKQRSWRAFAQVFSAKDLPLRARFRISEVETITAAARPGSVMSELLNVRDSMLRDRLVHRMEPAFEPKTIAPPIELDCPDQSVVFEQEAALHDPRIKALLTGPSEYDEEKLVERKVPVSEFPPPRLLPDPYLDSSSYSSIKIPAMSRFVTDSGKLARLDQLLTELKAGGHRILLYFQMTRMIDLMEEYLTYRQYKYLRLDGSSKLADRRDMVDDWQTRPDLFVFLLSTRAGGLGINLTAADTVIFYDSDWNPTIDSQAMDRAHRLGQTKQVTVYRLITRGTIEERILKRAKQKEEVQKVVISGGDYKQQPAVDFSKGSREVAMWLLDDDEMEAKLKERDAQLSAENSGGTATPTEAQRSKPRAKKRKLGAAVLDGPAERTLEDMYHEGEGNFDDNSGKPSEAATPTPSVAAEPTSKVKEKGRSHKKITPSETLAYVGNLE